MVVRGDGWMGLRFLDVCREEGPARGEGVKALFTWCAEHPGLAAALAFFAFCVVEGFIRSFDVCD